MTVKTSSISSVEEGKNINPLFVKAYKLMLTAKKMAELYDEKKEICSRYVHSTSRGHEAIQIAAGLHLRPTDFASLYYRDDSILLTLGFEPYELMLQLLAKKDDPFSGGRTYYNHPNVRREGFPVIPHQSSATGMQAIPATGMAHAIHYLEGQHLMDASHQSVAFCSLGDGSVTEGEVAEALQMAVLKGLPIVYLVQDNDWGISAVGDEMRAMNAYEYAEGFKGLKRMSINGSSFIESFYGMEEAFQYVREFRKPILVHATCPLLGHHTSGVRKEWYRGEEDLLKHAQEDPIPKLEGYLIDKGFAKKDLKKIDKEIESLVNAQFEKAFQAEDPEIEDFDSFVFVPTPITVESGERSPLGKEKVVMVDAALNAVKEILEDHPEALFYGQDVGIRLGGVFREAATLAKK
ncbi:MAG: thiamine pyrophosphate-dependent dehydrogenase E1 component subunit alpha, partial [Cyclobacteriaceae bacterium]|nr:thiamine pyrophosphate-dependent dehydrogenase E1 component subunit alpha [Cyclobacteriaceae bacterium]